MEAIWSRILHDNVEDASIIINREGKIIEANEKWRKLCQGNKLEENYFSLLTQYGKYQEVAEIKRVIKEKLGPKEIESFLTTDLHSSTYLVKVSSINLTATQFTGALISHSPLNLVPSSFATAEYVLKNMDDGFCFMDKHFNLTFINEAGCKILRFNKEKNIGKKLWTVFPELKNAYLFENEFQRAMKNRVEVQFKSFYEPMGTWFRVKVFPIEDGGLAVYFQDIGHHNIAEQVHLKLDTVDYLTGMANRKGMLQTLALLAEEAEDFSLLILSLDNLSVINSLYDHQTGDMVIRKIAKSITKFVEEPHHVGRFEGEKFFLIHKESHLQSKTDLLEKLKEAFEQNLSLDNRQSVQVKVSIGAASYPKDTQDLEQLLTYTETAVSAAKKDGTSKYVAFEPMMKIVRERRNKLEEGLFGDLNGSGFYFTLQPQINGNSGEIIGAEILSRWNHPEFGELSPLEFIEIAEETGTLSKLTHHLLNEVFRKMKEWHQQYGWNLKYAINMTPSLLSNQAFFNEFLVLMDQYDIQPSWLEVEITEQAELTYSKTILENLLICKSKGISIAIDDFGTGYSMISYLTKFPINKIKIDRYFIQKIGYDEKSESVLKSLIHLIKSIQCEILAEGVECIHEIQFLIQSGCSIFQGYHFDKPMDVRKFESKYLKNRYRFSKEE